MSQQSYNIVNLLNNREILSFRKKAEIENSLEDSFVKGKLVQYDLPLPASVSSTIAIAMSCDGRTFATTHGDHTVKVFVFHSKQLYREFTGHPRTPWTVKYHPNDPNILASGCLGYQVRVWNILENTCMSVIRLDFSIISLSFHPYGDHLAIASGSKLEIWEWRKSNLNQSSSPNDQIRCKSVSHVRNIRAVIFHPSGDYLFAAAPSSPKEPNEVLTYCSLYAIKFTFLFSDQSSQITTFELKDFPLLLPHIHLYSDGGLDISKDGDYLVTCARLFVLPTETDYNVSKTSPAFSPMSTTDRMEEEEFDFDFSAFLRREENRFVNWPNDRVSDRLQRRNISLDNLLRNSLPSNGSAFQLPPPQLRSPTQQPVHYVGQTEQSRFSPISQITGSNNNLFSTIPNIFPTGQSNSPNNFSSRPLSRMTYPRVASTSIPVVDIQNDDMEDSDQGSSTNNSNNNSNNNMFESPHKFLHLQLDTAPDIDSGPTSSNNELTISEKDLLTISSNCNSPLVSYRSSYIHHRRPIARPIRAQIYPIDPLRLEHDTSRGFQDNICVFKLNFADGKIISPSLVNAKVLKGSLLKAITSAKLSPTNRYVLLGYGVRSEGSVMDHLEPNVACEVINLQDPSLRTMTLMVDSDDEVNIAQFHPTPGFGIIYGTKKGRIRTYVRSTN